MKTNKYNIGDLVKFLYDWEEVLDECKSAIFSGEIVAIEKECRTTHDCIMYDIEVTHENDFQEVFELIQESDITELLEPANE